MRDGSVRILAADGSVAQISPAAGLGEAVPEAIASSATGHLLVSWPGIHLVTRFDATGQPAGARGAELRDGGGWCADGLGQVYAVDADGALGIFDVDGWCRLRLGAREHAGNPRPDPVQIAASFDGRFVASIDRERHAVLRFNVEEPTHAPLLVAARTGSAIAMAQPAGVAMDEESRIYALDRDTGTITVCDSSGALCFQFGGWGREPGRFRGPLRFAVSPRGGVAYVLDDGRGELVKFLLDHGRRVATVAASESMPALASAFIPGCDRQGLLYVVDGSRDLRVLDWRSHRPETVFLATLEALGAPSAAAMAVSPDGQVYLSGASGVVGLRW
ncbi:MAG: hypothetical protein H0W83_08450 [Planctomycetes bacterium]|nr:hypothetical protein [Planctomycetota bacterium]